MRKVTDWLLFFFMAVSLPAFSDDNVIDEVVWIIGDEAIYKSEVEEQYRQMQYDGQRIDGDPYCVIPEQLAVQKLFLHQAKLDTITVPDATVFQQVEARINYLIANIGSKEKMEEYFKSVGCEYVIVDVFAYNDIGKNFYNKKDYHARMETMIKKI